MLQAAKPYLLSKVTIFQAANPQSVSKGTNFYPQVDQTIIEPWKSFQPLFISHVFSLRWL